ncbi:acyl--CoA ligase [Alphaproteobacteria bacterium]|nr:acyl--CoA ligase [Alphaproteobacteria bacterium]
MKTYWEKLINHIEHVPSSFTWHEKDVVTKEDLLLKVNEISTVLKKYSIKGKLVAIISDNNVNQFCSILACGLLGGIPCPRGTPNYSDDNEAYNSKFNFISIVDSNGIDIHTGLSKIEIPKILEIDTIAMGYSTSGSTGGRTKIVFQSHDQLFRTELSINDRVKISQNGNELILTPFDNAYWFGRVRCCLAVGSSVCFAPPPINPLKAIKLLKNFTFTGLSCDTPLFSMLFDLESRSACTNLKRLSYLKVASAPLCQVRTRRFYSPEFSAKTKIYFNYGLTEAMRCCILVLPKEIDKLGSVGRPLEGVEIKIHDKGKNVHTKPNVNGEILTKGKHLSLGYDNFKDWDNRLFQGYFRTKDDGYLDADGFVYINGRIDDAINRGGKIIQPKIIEDLIKKYFLIECYIIGSPAKSSNSVTEVPVLITEEKAIENEDFLAIKGKIKNVLGPAFVPTEMYKVPKVPRTNNGKVKRLELKTWLGKKYETS